MGELTTAIGEPLEPGEFPPPDSTAAPPADAVLLTRPGHDLWRHVSSQIADLVALFDDGTLLVLKGHRADVNVRDFVQRARALGYAVRAVHEVTMDDLADRRRSGSASGTNQRIATAGGDFSTDVDPNAVGIGYIRNAFAAGATDVHIEVSHGANRTRVDARINTLIHPYLFEQAAEIGEKVVRALYNLGDAGEGTFSTTVSKTTRLSRQSVADQSGGRHMLPEGIKSCRYTSFPIQDGIGCSIRIHPVEAAGRSLRELGLAEAQEELLMELGTDGEGGLTLVAGMTGSGKTTMLKSWLEAVYRHHEGTKRFVGVQDPHEVDIVGMLSMDAAATDDAEARQDEYDAILKRIARADPDFLLLGEIRDRSSARLAMSLANFGTFVTSTFHAESAAALPFRLAGTEFGLEPSQVFNHHVTRGLAHLRLLPRTCPDCSIPIGQWPDRRTELHSAGSGALTADDVLRRYDRIIGRIAAYRRHVSSEPATFDAVRARGPGCPTCCGDGVAGRPRPLRGIRGMTIAAHVMRTDARFMALVRAGRISDAEAHAYHRDGDVNRLTSLDRAVAKVVSGEVDPATVLARFRKLQSDRFLAEDPGITGESAEIGA